jgi:hypothetical protein
MLFSELLVSIQLAGCWKFACEQLLDFYCSPNVVRVIKSKVVRLAEHLARIGAVRNASSILVGKPERKGLHGEPMHRWEGNVETGLREIGFWTVNWSHLAHDWDRRPAAEKTFGFRNRRGIAYVAERTDSFARIVPHGAN